MSQLFVDIETVREVKNFSDLSEVKKELFIKKFDDDIHKYVMAMKDTDIDYNFAYQKFWEEKAALYAEYSKVCCISLGAIDKDNLKIKSISGPDERALLIAFCEIADKSTSMIAHNGMEFDFPYLTRRMIINGIKVPYVLNTLGKKPWETNLEDTVKMWSGTAWNYRASLALLAECFGFENPKGDMDGSKVGEVFYSEDPERFNKIMKYCGGDVITLVNVYRKIKGLSIFNQLQIVYQ